MIDAWRIESARNADELGLLTSAATFGYRVALLGTDAVILIVADHIGWSASYALYGVLMSFGLVATLLATESQRADSALHEKNRKRRYGPRAGCSTRSPGRLLPSSKLMAGWRS